MKKWNEIRVAYLLAQYGTITETAKNLGVHRSTVLRHIDALEKELKTKLFIRSAKGYTPTKAGKDLMRVARSTDEQFNLLIKRTKGQAEELSGEFIITSLEHVVPILMPLLLEFQLRYPKLKLRYLLSDDIYKLEYGEAHIAIRTGKKPKQSGNIVSPLLTHSMALFASKNYLAEHGVPTTLQTLSEHNFIATDSDNHRAPFNQWMYEHIPESSIVFRSNSREILNQAIQQGQGIGFIFKHEAEKDPQLHQVMPELEWQIPHWLVTHTDLNKTAKVQAFIHFIAEHGARFIDNQDQTKAINLQ